jgi:hypothetical protein
MKLHRRCGGSEENWENQPDGAATRRSQRRLAASHSVIGRVNSRISEMTSVKTESSELRNSHALLISAIASRHHRKSSEVLRMLGVGEVVPGEDTEEESIRRAGQTLRQCLINLGRKPNGRRRLLGFGEISPLMLLCFSRDSEIQTIATVFGCSSVPTCD